MNREVKLRIAKWQGPVSPTGRIPEAARVAQEVPSLNLWPAQPTREPWGDDARRWNALHQQDCPIDWAAIEARITAWAKENGMVEVDRIHDEVIFEPIAEENDADRM